MLSRYLQLRLCIVILLLSAVWGSAIAEPGETRDPFERFNRSMFTFNDRLDRAVLEPLARGYNTITPQPVNTMISNFFNNIADVAVVANDVLQLDFGQALRNTTRIVYNTSFGIGGLFDVARFMELPKSQQDFGQTLAHWGVGEGYYLVLPVFGPSTTRDVWRLPVDAYLFDPTRTIDSEGVRWGLRSLNAVDTRAGLLGATRLLDEAALDPYSFMREAYLQRRRALILGEDAALPSFDFDFDDDDDDF